MVFNEFLPLSWEVGEEGTQKAHGIPQVSAMKLVMALCSAGRHLTAHLVRYTISKETVRDFKHRCTFHFKVSNFNLLSVVSRYTVVHPCDLGLPREKAYELAITSLKTWTVTLSYGMGDVSFR